MLKVIIHRKMGRMLPLFYDDGIRNSYAKTPTEQYFQTIDDMVPLFEAFNKHKRSADLLEIVSEEVQLVRGIIPRLIKLRGQAVMLVLGFCMKPQEGACKTDRVIHALEMDGRNPILFLDLRNECRRLLDETGCKPISVNEVEILMVSKALELKVAQEEFDITIKSVFLFSSCWDDARWDRILDALSLAPPPYYHEPRHVSWMSHYQFSAFAERISNAIMQDWSKDQIMLSFKKAGLLEGKLVPRIPLGFADKFRSIRDRTKSEDLTGEVPIKIKSKYRLHKRRILPKPTIETKVPLPPGRKRQNYTSLACQNCRQRKEKCDGVSPCGRCVRLGDECVAGAARIVRRQSCEMCSVKKRACDLGKPSCEQCTSRGQDCVYG